MTQVDQADHGVSSDEQIDRVQRILDRRAEELAQAADSKTTRHATIEVLSVKIAEEHYAVETRYVREVIRASKITPVPETPAFIVGVTNLRGQVLAIMDLGELLGCPVQNASPWILTVGRDAAEFGILVDHIGEVVSLETRSIHAASQAVREVSQPFVRGVTSDALIVLDGHLLLQDERLVIDEEN